MAAVPRSPRLKAHHLAIVTIVSAALAASTYAQITAQTAPAPKPAAKSAVKPTKKTAPKAPVEAPVPVASDEQKSAAAMAHLGAYSCEFDQSVSVAADAKHEGYLDVTHKAQGWLMKPVLSSTGALRLEDVKGHMLMIQIANKSMLMDTKIGQRLVDACQSDKQREFARTMEPPVGLLK